MASKGSSGKPSARSGNEAGWVSHCAVHPDLFMRHSQLDLATNQARQTVKRLASKGDVKSARILAKEVVRSNRQKDRLSVSKARLGSIGIQLTQQMGTSLIQILISSLVPILQKAMLKVTGSLQMSTEIMKLSNALVKLPQISQTMREMSMEMTKVRASALS